jgi:hypothetical protein
MSATDVVLRYDKHSIVASGNTVTIDGKETYDLTAVSEVAFDTYRRNVNGYYAGTYFTLEFKQGGRTGSVKFNTIGDANLAEYQGAWEAIANRVYAIAIPRIAEGIAARVRAGEKVILGPPATRIVLTLEGVKSSTWGFGKIVPWSQVTRTDMYQGRHRVLGRKTPGAEETELGSVLVGWWNSYAIPTVVSLLLG